MYMIHAYTYMYEHPVLQDHEGDMFLRDVDAKRFAWLGLIFWIGYYVLLKKNIHSNMYVYHVFNNSGQRLREGGDEDGDAAASATHINASAAQAAMNAKVKTLPCLQANQDPYSSRAAHNYNT